MKTQEPIAAAALAATFALAAEASAADKTVPVTLATPAIAAAATAASAPVPLHARSVVDFWRAAGPGLWFAKNPAFDRRFREQFLWLYLSAKDGALVDWRQTPEGALALVLLLDQFPRNAFRGTSRMYATDSMARKIADAAVKAQHDQAVEPALRLFLYLPFGHSEDLVDQERSVTLAEGLGEPSVGHARHHRDIIKRFGRFPHRNPILGRAMTEDEQRYLDAGGFAG